MTLSKHSILYICLFALTLAACGDDDGEPDDQGHEDGGSADGGSGGGGGEQDGAAPSGIEVAGTWASEWGDESIDDTMWSGYAIVSFDNDANEAITQDAPSEDDAGVAIAGTFSKLVWTEIENDTFYYCTVSYGQPSAADADTNTMPADDTNPDEGGCGDGDFAWTKLERK